MGGMGGLGGGLGGGMGGAFGGGMPGGNLPPVNDGTDPNLPPEERYKDKLDQLNDMGFTNRDLNLQILQQVGGNTDLAVERLLGLMG